MKTKNIISALMAFLVIVCLFPTSASAAGYTITKSGAYTMSAQGYANGDTVTIASGLTVTLIGDSTVTYTNFTIACGQGVTLTLSNVNIDEGEYELTPLAFSGGGNTLILADGTTSTLKGGRSRAGVVVNDGVELTITGSGTLNAIAGDFYEAQDYSYHSAAGIGGQNGSSGSITISGGTINATGSRWYGAGIGGGYEGNGTVTITGGTVTASGGSRAAGIGGGYEGNGTVVITGGTVNATAGAVAAGLGGGVRGGGDVKISGGAVTAAGSAGQGSGIGGETFATVEISGGTVTATSSFSAAGIGTCGNRNNDSIFDITISGGTVIATGNSGAGIGRANGYISGTIHISGGTVFASGLSSEFMDIDSGTAPSASVNISDSAVVFLRRDTITPVNTTSHAHLNYDAETAVVYGVPIPADWTEAFGAYLRVCTLNYDANGGSGAPEVATQLCGTPANTAQAEGLSRGNYLFTGWNTQPDGSGSAYPAGDLYPFAASETLYAQWDGTDVTVVSSNDTCGSAIGGGEIEPGTDVTVTAESNSGCYFSGWYADSTLVSSDASYTFTAGDDVAFIAHFDPYLTINAVSSDNAYGSVSGGGSYTAGAQVTLTTSPNPGYYFIGWYNGDELVSSDASYTFSASESVMLTAKFGAFITVTAASGNTAYGSATGGGQYKPGEEVTVTAAANSGYSFIGWYKDDALVSTGAAYTFTAEESITLTAQFDVVVGIPETISVTGSTYNKISLAWSSVQGAAGYRIWRSTSENGTFKAIGTTVTTSYTDSGLSILTRYYYKVQACASARVCGKYYSMTVSATTTFGQVTGVSVTSSDPKSATIKWSALAGATDYQVWRTDLEDAAEGDYTFIAITKSREFTNSGLTTDHTYYYKVIGGRAISGDPVYSDFSDAVAVTPAVAQVTGITAARTSASKVKISWNAVSGATKYELWVADTNDGTFTFLGETKAKYWVDATGSARYYKVRAYTQIINTKHYGEYSGVVTP